MLNAVEETHVNESFNLGIHVPNLGIDASTNETLCFAENLLICAKNELSSDTKPIGGYCITIEKIGPESREFLVNVAASMNIDGCFSGGSKLIGTLTENFQCLEEKRNEYLNRADGTYRKCLFIGNEDDSYHVVVDTNCPCNSLSHTADILFESHPKLLGEAGNIILMRYLALTNYRGAFSLESMTIEGKIEACDYRCNSAEWMKLDDRHLEVYTVERRNKNAADACRNRESKTLLTKQGRILRHDWLNLPFLLRINPLKDPGIIDNKNYVGLGRPLRDFWPDDFELLGKYLDRKTCTVAQQTNYFVEHPEIKKLIADYTQSLLIVKPLDVIDFTIQHFRSFAALPESSLSEGNTSSSDN